MDNKIKVAIVTQKMIMGGIEKSLLELVKELHKIHCEITLYVVETGGELYSDIPSYVKVVEIFKENSSIKQLLKKNLQNKNIKAIKGILGSYIYNKFKWDPVKSWKYTSSYLETNLDEYEYAFSYGAPVSFSVVYTANNIKAKKKYTWIHNDVEHISLEIQRYKNIFEPFDKILCVSQSAKDSFERKMPELIAKTEVFYNYIDRTSILIKAQKSSEMDFCGVKILTVGRICPDKGQDIIPQIAKNLKKAGVQFRWYCVGSGDWLEQVEKIIKDMDLTKDVLMLGNRENPYPYFRSADVYCQTSRNEGFGITISEAKLFSLPIVTTDFSGAAEQIEDGVTGFITRFDVDEISNKLLELIQNPTLVLQIKKNLGNDGKKCYSKITDLIKEERRN